jgi:hypothetical protein
VPRYRDGCFLNDLIGFGIGKSGFDGEIADQLAIDAVKFLPALRVIANGKPVEEAGACLNRAVLGVGHRCHATASTPGREKTYKEYLTADHGIGADAGEKRNQF